ncbi:HpcH/HpaI aldolase/citrate lyase family protein [Anoxynatronum buryatiense]|uniref:Citrate lyase subunit beta / citryl-CoA lyase n=1 Tax=Anoxynatronum buryatiense TaxID=489973 RepID=A0AA45WWR6_9CLOT|nr:aldolase/citrate lyase family protein [Anoxynatronum buryatiense]SMP60486.1 citrate lyase subunit beta / citryl-CoA lyase [Anoxynatronum buryatiense]
MKGLRRSMLFVPGNHPGMIQNADIYGSDSIIFDLEDAVSLQEKDSARLLVKHALRKIDFGETERVVRINPLDTGCGTQDLKMMVAAGPDALMIPKATARRLIEADLMVGEIEAALGGNRQPLAFIPIIESAVAVEEINELLKASSRIVAALLGGEDLTADLGIQRTKAGDELLYARSRVAMACCACGVDAIDTPYADTMDDEGLAKDTAKGKTVGFTGKAAIHPLQIEVIHRVYAPSEAEIHEARQIIRAMKQAEREGKGAVAVDGRMVDAPIILRAEKLLQQAKAMGVHDMTDNVNGGA